MRALTYSPKCCVCADSTALSVQVEHAVFDFLASQSGSYKICVVLGEQLLGSAVKVIVKSMSPMAASIQISFHRKPPGISTDEAGIKTTVRVRRRDLFGNPYDHFEDGIAEGPLTWARSLPLPQCPFFIVAKVLICISVHGNNRGHIRPLDPTRICTHAKAQVPPRTALLCPGAQLLCN